MANRRRRRIVRVLVELSVKPGITAAEARRELRTRNNDLCCWSQYIDEEDVRVRKMTPVAAGKRLL